MNDPIEWEELPESIETRENEYLAIIQLANHSTLWHYFVSPIPQFFVDPTTNTKAFAHRWDEKRRIVWYKEIS